MEKGWDVLAYEVRSSTHCGPEHFSLRRGISVRGLRRRFSPTLQYASTANIFPNLTGVAPTNANAAQNRAGLTPGRPNSTPVFSVAVYVHHPVRDEQLH